MATNSPATQAAGTNARILLTEDQVAERWQLSKKKLQNDRYMGRGVTYVKLDRSVRYDLRDIERYEVAHKVNGFRRDDHE